MDQLLGKHNLLKLTQEEIEDLTRPTSVKEIESKLISFPNRKYQVQMGLLMNITKHLRKKLNQFSRSSFRG